MKPMSRRPALRAAALALTTLALASLGTAPAAAAGADCEIFWNEVLHDTFNPDYRGPVGAVATGAAPTVRLRLRVAQSDLTSARIRLWDDRANVESYHSMAWDGAYDTDPVTYDWWVADLPLSTQPTILYYFFELNDNGAGGSCTGNGGRPDTDWYTDDEPQFYGGGYGGMSDAYNDQKSFQITVYDAAAGAPEWLQRATIYQIFPDRFRNDDLANDPPAGGGFVYGQPIYRPEEWNRAVCDPRLPAGPCPNAYSNNFYGGDLAGITRKIDEGYFDDLGVTVLYLNPIFRSPSNHRYDTADYLRIDPTLGDGDDFRALAAAAASHGMRLILDGVFNHTSSDSTYFDFYSRYDAAGNLTSPGGPGADDDSGACEANAAPTYGWYYFPDIGNPGGGGVDLCYNGPNDEPQTYEAWFGFGSLPKLKSGEPAVRDLVYAQGTSSVGPYWIAEGAGGWRLDVGGDVDCGATCDPANTFWEGFRAAVRAVDPQAAILGEEWGDASAWLLGGEWDAVMNYRFRSAALGLLAANHFEDNDSRPGLASGPIDPLPPSLVNARLLSIWEDYPPAAHKGMMNLTGSHDTNRLRFLLRKANGDSDAAALARLRQWFHLVFSYAGAPAVYYGDEVALVQDGAFHNGVWEDDPYNRAPYPWADTPGDFTADESMRQHVARLAGIRRRHRVLQDGDVHHGLVVDDSRQLYGFGRTNAAGEVALVVLGNDAVDHPVTLSGLDQPPYLLPDGTVLVEQLAGTVHEVAGGTVTLSVPAGGAAIAVRKGPLDLAVSGPCPGPVTLAVSAALPGSDVALLASLEPGAAIVPSGPCAGTRVDLARPQRLATLTADAAGEAATTLNAPAGACAALFQALDLGGCEVSPVERLP